MGNLLFQSLPDDHLLEYAVFQTELGWAGLVFHQEHPLRLSIGHKQREHVLPSLEKFAPGAGPVVNPDSGWLESLRGTIQRFSAGEPAGFEEFTPWLEPKTEFQQKVFRAAFGIPYGETWSYRQLAEAVGSPRAARAIGNVMASNPLPILIPCHRVIGSDGKLHGFSAPQGTDLKQRLLDLETCAVNS